jgi:TPR repeat protein
MARTGRLVLAGLAAAWLALAAMALPAWAQASPERRVALVIGNGDYLSVGRLANAPNDARAIGATLQRLGFDVEMLTDQNKIGLEQALRRFSRRAEGAAIALFFYAGHGIQANDVNYLLPIDANPERLEDLRFDAVDVGAAIGAMQSAAIRLVFLDACRNNPLAATLAARGRSVTRGLARIETADANTLIAFATAPGMVADDGEGANSPFTAALVAHLPEAGVELAQMLRRVRNAVMAATGDRQVPWDNSSLRADIYLAGAPTLAAAPPGSRGPDAPGPGVPALDPRLIELSYWESIRNGADRAAFAEYIQRVERGEFAGLFLTPARTRLAELTAAPAGAPQAPASPGPAVNPQQAAVTPRGPAPVDECDRLAAPPLAPEHLVAGVLIDRMDGASARRACEAARRAYPDEPRFMAYLGRAMQRQSDYSEAVRYYRIAADRGHPFGQAALGYMYRYGLGVTEDDGEAARLYRLAADQGNTMGLTNLGILHLSGRGVAKDDGEAVRLFTLAADQGDAVAQVNLGFMYAHGRGVAEDRQRAIEWYRRAARQGNQTAIDNLRQYGVGQ